MKTCVTPLAVERESFDGQRVRALISAESLDRSSEVLLAAGADLAAYRRNPVVLWSHDAALPPIGRALEVTAEPGVGVWAVNEFAATPFAREIAELYREGFLHAFSVGFRPLELSRRPVADGQQGATVVRWELVEQSAVAVPANPDALVTAADGGNRAADWLLKTYYQPLDDAALLAQAGLPAEPSWPDLAVAVCRLAGLRGGLPLAPASRARLTELLAAAYAQRGLTFPTLDGGRPLFRHDEPDLFEEREMTELAASLRGRAEALRNIARKRRRRGRSLPELDPVRAALTHLREVADGPGGAPSAGAAETAAGALSTALRELRQDLEQLANRRDRAIAAALDTFRRGAIGG